MLSSDKVELKAISDIEAVWPTLIPLLHKMDTINDGKYLLDDIKQQCIDLYKQLWVAYQADLPIACAITQIACYNNGKRLQIVYLSGQDIDQLKQFYKPIADWAKTNGCTCTEIYGRQGWKRKLKDWNLTPIYTVYRVDFE